MIPASPVINTPSAMTVATHIGTLTVGRTSLLGIAPVDSGGVRVRGIQMTIGASVPPSPTDYWRFLLGTIANGVFTGQWEIAMTRGIGTWVEKRVEPEVRVPRGGTLAFRAIPYGNAPTVEHLSAALDYIILPGR